jgi:hypothetical protein
MVVLHPTAIAVIPFQGGQGLQPRRSHNREAVQGGAQRLPHALEPIEDANGRLSSAKIISSWLWT